jgi:hypothetical protein
MKKLLIPLFGLVLVGAVAFVLVELRAPLSSGTEPPATHKSAFADPGSAPPPSSPSSPSSSLPAKLPPRPERPPPLPPLPKAAPGSPDPADVVIDGKTRREWHVYYADRQRKTTIEILRYQTTIDRAVAGEEPDPHDLAVAHDRVRELNQQLKDDIAALQRIDANP